MFGNSISHTKNQFSTSKNRKVGKQCILKSLLMLGYLKVNLGENLIFSFILGSMDLIRCPGEIEQFWNPGSAQGAEFGVCKKIRHTNTHTTSTFLHQHACECAKCFTSPISKHILILLLQYVEQLQFL